MSATKPKPGDLDYVNLSIPYANEAKARRKRLYRELGVVITPSGSAECPHCHLGFDQSVIIQHIREKHIKHGLTP